MKNTQRTPYEVRLETLQLAATILHEQHATARSQHEKGLGNTLPVAPTSEDVIAEARKLNEFISSNAG